MMRHVWTGAAAGAALLGTAALLHAQQPPDRGQDRGQERSQDRDQGPSLRGSSPESKGQHAPAPQQRPGMDRPNAMEPGKDRSKGAERPDRDGPRAADQPDKSSPKGAERPQRDVPRTADQPDRDRPKGAERPDKTRPGLAQPDTSSGADKGAGRARLSAQQRSEVRSKLPHTGEKARVQANVGSRLPRSVRLHPLPSAIIALAPTYRGYSYLVREDDSIIIVDAGTYVVVDVIPPPSRTAGLSLSPDQMRFIYARVPKDHSVDIRVRLGLGAEVPPDVELLPFPPEVLARIPDVQGYRYVVANDDVAIVDPSDNSIALVIGD